MKNVLELLTKRVERELNAKDCVIDIFKTQNLKKLKREDGTYWHNGEQILISDMSEVAMRDDYTCVGCDMRAQFVVIARNIHGNSSSRKYILFYYIVDKATGDLKKLTKDHIIPRSLGGQNRMDNYQCMCEQCNGRKANVLYGLDIEQLIKDRVNKHRIETADWIDRHYRQSNIILRIFGVKKVLNRISNKLRDFAERDKNKGG